MNASGAQTLQASKIMTTFDIDEPEVRSTFFKVRGDQGMNYFTLLEMLGYDRAVASNKTRQYEEDWIHQSITLGTDMVATGNPNEYEFTLSTVSPNIDYLEQNVTSPYNTADQYVFPVKINDRIPLPGGNMEATLQVTNKVIAGNTCTITAIHTNPTSAPFTLANMVAGTTLIISTNSHSEGSDQDGGQVNKPLIDYAYTQIIKTTWKITGSQLTQQVWIKTYSDSSGAIVGYRTIGQRNTEYEHALAIDQALLWGTLTEVSLVDSNTSEPYQSTEGLIPYARRKGQNLPYIPGTFNVPLFDNMNKLLDQQGAPLWMAFGMGISLSDEKDNVFKDYFANTSNQDYIRSLATRDLFGNKPGITAEVGFNYFEKGGRRYCFTTFPQFNMPKLQGASGYNAQNLGIMWPLGTKTDKNNPDNRIPYMGMIHREMAGYSRKAEVFHIDGAGPGLKVTSRDQNKLCMRSDIGAEHCGGNQMIRLFPQ